MFVILSLSGAGVIYEKRPLLGRFFYFMVKEVRKMKKRILIYFVDGVNLEKIYMRKKGLNYSHYDGNILPEKENSPDRISKGFRLFEMSRDGYPGD